MTPTIQRTPVPEDGRARNAGARRNPHIDALVDAAKDKPGAENAILIADSAPKSRAQAYIRRGCKAVYRHDPKIHPLKHYARIWVYWPKDADK